MITKLLLILFTAIFIENYIFSKFYGVCPFLGVSKDPATAVGMGLAVTGVMTVSGAATWLLYRFVLVPFGLTYLDTLAFILVIAALVQALELFLKKMIPSLYRALGIYLPLITTNCAVLGAALTGISDFEGTLEHFASAVVYSFGSALGFLFAIVLFAGVRKRLESALPPKAFQGIPLALISAGLVAIAFSGFSGMRF
ncbi:MAG: electron transport complex subunit RsxA [Clostridia bacterium]|nr:electron transport complex subunit RsxA [Clostridia bacterium]